MTTPKHTVEAAMYFATHNATVFRAVQAMVNEPQHQTTSPRLRFAQLVGGEEQQSLLINMALENGLHWTKLDGPGLTYQISARDGAELYVAVPMQSSPSARG